MMKRAGKLETEKKTVRIMVGMYCGKNHNAVGDLCPDCEKLLAYAEGRLDACPFGDEKTACGKCTVHCYRPDMRKKISSVMRYSGPRILFAHPMLVLRHMARR